MEEIIGARAIEVQMQDISVIHTTLLVRADLSLNPLIVRLHQSGSTQIILVLSTNPVQL